MKDRVQLTREVRFGINSDGTAGGLVGNGFAGNPGLGGLGVFVVLRVAIAGRVDPQTGMLINIKEVDRTLRTVVVEKLRSAIGGGRGAQAGAIARALFAALAGAFAPHRLDRLDLEASPFLVFHVAAEEPAMVSTSLRFEFSAAHRLHAAALSDEQNRELFGRCNNPSGHGHNYELEVTVASPIDSQGQGADLAALQRVVNARVIDSFDHKHLNVDCPDFRDLNPTVENIARVIWGRLQGQVPGTLRRIRVWETPKTVCEFTGDADA